MKFLRPIKDKQAYTRKIFKAIFTAWFNAFWQYLMDAIDLVDEYYNSKDVLIEAIMSHRIQYVDGKFTGNFNAAISKRLLDIGAKYDKRSKAFVIARNKLPIDINHAIAVASLATATMYKRVLDFLNSFNPSSMMPLVNGQIDAQLDEVLEDLDDQAKRTIEDSITVKVHLSPTEKENLKKMYTDNLQLPIKNFSNEQVVRMRELIQKNLLEGLGDKALVDVLMKEFNVTRNKAMFWARQETGLLVSAYRQATYKTVGITKYKWSTSHDERVRVMHKDLDGKIFEFANPPVTNEKGDRNNPGEDWQCRCQAIPVLEGFNV